MYAVRRHLRRHSAAAFLLLLLVAAAAVYLVGLHEATERGGARLGAGVGGDGGSWEAESLNLELALPADIRQARAAMSQADLYRQYGFNLALSDALPLNRSVSDHRLPACRERAYPHGMPKASRPCGLPRTQPHSGRIRMNLYQHWHLD